MKISKEIKVGIVAVFALGLLVWGYNYLKGTNLFVDKISVYAIYPKVPGLAVSSPIIINGVQSGVVEDIFFHPDKSSRVVVKLSITEKSLMIPENSIADLISIDFLGSKAIGLYLGNSRIELESGDTLISHAEKSVLDDVTEQILPIKEKAENLMFSMDSAIIGFNETMSNLNDVFNERNKRNLGLAIANLETTIENFNLLSQNLNSTINTSIKPTMKTYKDLGDSLAQLDLKSTIEKTQITLDNLSALLEKINSGQGTMGKLVNNDSLYNNLTAASKEMEELLEDVKLNPKRYTRILSKKQIPYKKNP